MVERKWLRKQKTSVARKIAQDSSTASKHTISPAMIQRALEDPSPDNLTPEVVASLQESHGNAFVNSLVGGNNKVSGGLAHPIQAKLTVTPAGDQYEQEADAVAAQVVQTMNNGGGQSETAQRAGEEEELQMKRISRVEEEELMQGKRIDRAGEEEELQMKRIDRMEEEELQMKRIDRYTPEEDPAADVPDNDPGPVDNEPEQDPVAPMPNERPENVPVVGNDAEEELQMKRIQREGEEEELQMKRIQRAEDPMGGMEVSQDIENAIQQKAGSGNPLPDTVKGPMENAMGADFSNVRVHNDNESDALNKSVAAKAFTTGSDIFFGKDEFKPNSKDGQELLAHELTHVVQQTGAQRKEKED